MSSGPETGTSLKYALAEPERRRDLDLARQLIVFSLIVFHIMRIFAELDFHVKNDPTVPPLAAPVFFAAIWGMPLLFTVVGSD